MHDYIRPDRCFEVPIQGGVLKISPSVDFLHYLPNGAWMLKYWDTEHNPSRMCNVFMHEDAAHFLMTQCDVEVIAREHMGEQEYDQYLGWAANHTLMDLDFVPEEPESE
jgi:hypothetical protein